MPRLVALDLAPGPRFVTEVTRVLDDGDAFLPLDQRLPMHARHEIVRRLGATTIRTDEGDTSLDGGTPVEEGDAVVIATSGSSGRPKGVVLTRRALSASAVATARRLEANSDAHWLACLPLSHVGGLSVILRALENGSRLTVHERFHAPDVAEAARSGCTHVSLVPTALRRIDPSLFHRILLGGARPPVDRPANVIATYGLTETGSGIVYDGRPLDGVEICIGTDDEILVRSPMNMRCYRDGSTAIDDDGWLHTGDIGTYANGRLDVLGRVDDLIKTGGEKVWPDVVERAIAQRWPESEICIVGVADREWGQRVVLTTTDPGITRDAVRDVVIESLPNFCVPKQVVVLPEFPRIGIGKVRRADVTTMVEDLVSDDQ